MLNKMGNSIKFLVKKLTCKIKRKKKKIKMILLTTVTVIVMIKKKKLAIKIMIIVMMKMISMVMIMMILDMNNIYLAGKRLLNTENQNYNKMLLKYKIKQLFKKRVKYVIQIAFKKMINKNFKKIKFFLKNQWINSMIKINNMKKEK